jgi:hypothetical protein
MEDDGSTHREQEVFLVVTIIEEYLDGCSTHT